VTAARRKGATLVLVLWVLLVAGAVGASATHSARGVSVATDAARARLVARHAAESAILATAAGIQAALQRAEGNAGARAVLLAQPEALAERAGEWAWGDGRAQASVVDVSARLDINVVDEAALVRFFSAFGPADAAAQTAAAIRRRVAGTPAEATPVRSLDALGDIPGVDTALLARAAGDMTVDGDGQFNRRSASPAVRAALGTAGGEEPTRLLIVARGWRDGHPYTHEVQAVYQVEGTRLTFVRWRERDR
jgi:hypothetical protein